MTKESDQLGILVYAKMYICKNVYSDMTKEELRSTFKGDMAKPLEQNLYEVAKVLSSNFETGFEFGFKIGLRLSVDIACGLLDSMTEGRLGDRFMMIFVI